MKDIIYRAMVDREWTPACSEQVATELTDALDRLQKVFVTQEIGEMLVDIGKALKERRAAKW
jgi:hypothetical protein